MPDRSDSTLARGHGAARRARAAFTIVQNEARFLPLWLRYYGRQFDMGDLFVLDHGTTDGSTAAIAGSCTIVPVHRTVSFDHEWLRSTVSAFQNFLLQSYEVVLFAEVDEFVVAHPGRHPNLAAYIEGWESDAARCTGFNVAQEVGEAALAFDQPVLAQRAFWHPAPMYAKTLLARAPMSWGAGFHTEVGGPGRTPDPDLLLVHLHRVDYEYCLTRHRAAAARPWSEHDVAAGLGWQNRVTDTDRFREWFYSGDDLGGSAEPIPDLLRGAL